MADPYPYPPIGRDRHGDRAHTDPIAPSEQFQMPSVTRFAAFHAMRSLWHSVEVPLPRKFPAEHNHLSDRSRAPPTMMVPTMHARCACDYTRQLLRQAWWATCASLAARVPQCVDMRYYETMHQLVECEEHEQLEALHAALQGRAHADGASAHSPRALALWLLLSPDVEGVGGHGHGHGSSSSLTSFASMETLSSAGGASALHQRRSRVCPKKATALLHGFARLAAARVAAGETADALHTLQPDVRLASHVRFGVACRDDAAATLPPSTDDAARQALAGCEAALLVTWATRDQGGDERGRRTGVLLPLPTERMTLRDSGQVALARNPNADRSGPLDAARVFDSVASLLHAGLTACRHGDVVACDPLVAGDLRRSQTHTAPPAQPPAATLELGASVPMPSAWWRARLSDDSVAWSRAHAWHTQHALTTKAVLRSLTLPTELRRQRVSFSDGSSPAAPAASRSAAPAAPASHEPYDAGGFSALWDATEDTSMPAPAAVATDEIDGSDASDGDGDGDGEDADPLLRELPRLVSIGTTLRLYPWESLLRQRHRLQQTRAASVGSENAWGSSFVLPEYTMDSDTVLTTQRCFDFECLPAVLLCGPSREDDLRSYLSERAEPYFAWEEDTRLRHAALHVAYAAYGEQSLRTPHKLFALPRRHMGGSALASLIDAVRHGLAAMPHMRFVLRPLDQDMLGYQACNVWRTDLGQPHSGRHRYLIQQMPWHNFGRGHGPERALAQLDQFVCLCCRTIEVSSQSLPVLQQTHNPLHVALTLPCVWVLTDDPGGGETADEARRMLEALARADPWRTVRPTALAAQPRRRFETHAAQRGADDAVDEGDVPEATLLAREHARLRSVACANALLGMTRSSIAGEVLAQAATAAAIDPTADATDAAMIDFLGALCATFGPATPVQLALTETARVLRDYSRHRMDAAAVLQMRHCAYGRGTAFSYSLTSSQARRRRRSIRSDGSGDDEDDDDDDGDGDIDGNAKHPCR